MSEKVITLPNHEDMLQRLCAMDYISQLHERFCSLLLEHAGEERSAQGVVDLLFQSIYNCTKDMPWMWQTSRLLLNRAHAYVDALVDDPEVAQAAKSILAEVRMGNPPTE
jgi:hypothetical protein